MGRANKQREQVAAIQHQVLFLVSKAKRTDAETIALESLLETRRVVDRRLARWQFR